jgi:hypothetical protein
MKTEDQHINIVRWNCSDYDAPMSTTGTGFSGAGRIVLAACMIFIQSLSFALAQTRPSQQQVKQHKCGQKDAGKQHHSGTINL